MTRTEFAFYCICGGAMTGEVDPEAMAPELERHFDAIHRGGGHARCDRETSHRARRWKRRDARTGWVESISMGPRP